MNEGKTTGIFFVVATIALGLAWWSKPAPIINESDIARLRIGEDVFLDFSDPTAAASLQIAQYDEELAQLKRFEVARDSQTGLWTLPSNDDYPADAAEQVKDATTPLIGLRILNVETESRADHEDFGVVNPDDEELAAGASGVGMLVTLKDSKDSILASLVIGNEVAQAEGQRYVRIPTEDAVYSVELNVDAFSTNFRDWIEGELLGVRSFDITRIGVRDYSLQKQSLTTMALQRNFDAEVDYDSSASEWTLASYQTYEGGSASPAELAENESLNKEFLNAMRTAAQDLEIVDVQRKPKGLAADLKADEALLKDQESVSSLQTQGFYPAGGPDGTEIYAAGGETIVGTDEGVRYVLRFGEATASLASLDDSDGDDSGLSRYLLVTARLDESKFPFPELDVAPETVEEMLAMEREEAGEVEDDSAANDEDEIGAAEQESSSDAETQDAETQDAETQDAETQDAETQDSGDSEAGEAETGNTGLEAAANEALDEATSTESGQSDEDSSAEGNAAEDNAESNSEDGPAEDSDEAPAADSEDDGNSEGDAASEEVDDCGPPQDEQASESDSEEEAASTEESSDESAAESEDTGSDAQTDDADAQPSDSQGDEPAAETEEELIERLEAKREEIARENQRKIDERNEKLEEARKSVQELNARFSEWYYVVSDSEYSKLKLSRENLIKTEEPEMPATPNFSEGLLQGGLQNPLPQQP